MLEVAAAISVASKAFSAIKSAVEMGREIEDVMGQLSQWAGAVADIDKLDSLSKKKKGSLFKSLIPKDGKSIQQQAMDAYTAKIAVQKQRDELRQLIQYSQGINGWHEFLHMEKQVREERQKTVHAEMERRQRLKDFLIGVGLVVLSIATVGLALVLIIAVKNSGQ